MTKINSNDDRESKLAKLEAALASFASSPQSRLIDRELEKRKATVRNRALGLLDHRARSEQELRGRLIDAEFEPQVVDEVIEDLKRSGLVDDRQFAIEWVRQRHERRKKSSRALDLELQRKGVSPTVRAEALETIDTASEEAAATDLAARKARTIRVCPADRKEYEKLLARIVGMLARRGYPQGMAMTIARDQLDQRIVELGED